MQSSSLVHSGNAALKSSSKKGHLGIKYLTNNEA